MYNERELKKEDKQKSSYLGWPAVSSLRSEWVVLHQSSQRPVPEREGGSSTREIPPIPAMVPGSPSTTEMGVRHTRDNPILSVVPKEAVW